MSIGQTVVKSDRIGTVPIRAVTASFSEPFTEALPLYPPDIKEQNCNLPKTNSHFSSDVPYSVGKWF